MRYIEHAKGKSAVVVILWIVLMLTMPLQSAFEIGGDEGIELLKAFQFHGPPEWRHNMWNDQPTAYTRLVAGLFSLFAPDAIYARLLAVAFSSLLLYALLRMLPVSSGFVPRLVVAVALAACPYTIELSCSGMLEMPAMALGVFAVSLLPHQESHYPAGCWKHVLSGLFLGAACTVKLTAAFAIPWGIARIWYGFSRPSPNCKAGQTGWLANAEPARLTAFWLLTALGILVSWFVFVEGNLPFDRLIGTHFDSALYLHRERPGALSYQFSPDALVSEWWILPLVTVLSFSCSGFSVRRAAVPVIVALAAAVGMHLIHRPWWYYYHLHFSLLLAFVAGLSFHGMEVGTPVRLPFLMRHPRLGLWASASLLAAGLVVMIPNALRNIEALEATPATKNNALATEFCTYARDSTWCFTRFPMYAFRARIPCVPELVVLVKKRFWSGAIDEAALFRTVARQQPGILLLSDSVELKDPRWKDFLKGYESVYDDGLSAIFISMGGRTSNNAVRAR